MFQKLSLDKKWITECFGLYYNLLLVSNVTDIPLWVFWTALVRTAISQFLQISASCCFFRQLCMNYNISLVTKTYHCVFFGQLWSHYKDLPLFFWQLWPALQSVACYKDHWDWGGNAGCCVFWNKDTVQVFINRVHDTYVSLSTMFITAYAHLN